MFTLEFEKSSMDHSTVRQMIRHGLKERIGKKPTEKLSKELQDKLHLISTNYSLKKKESIHKAKEGVHELREKFPKKAKK